MDYIKLRNTVENNKITITELCKKVHIDRKTFYNNLENQTLKVETLEKICLVLGLPVSEFFNKNIGNVHEPIEKYHLLPNCEKELLQALKELNQVRKEKENLMDQLLKHQK